MRWRWLILAGVVALAGCSSESGGATSEATEAPTTAQEPTTGPPSSPASTAASTTSKPAVAAPVHLRYGPAGITWVDGTSERILRTDGVMTASHDGMGGVLFTSGPKAWQPGLHWRRAGSTAMETLPYDDGWVAVLDGRPALVTVVGSCGGPDGGSRVHLVDLTSGVERNAGCFGGEAGGPMLNSGGGSLLVGVTWAAVGSNGTDRTIDFYDSTGAPIEHPHNPVAESCEPCELDTALSPDGALLAYRLRPDAKWSADLEEQRRLDALSYDEWWATSREIPARVAVVDLETGETRFTLEVPAVHRLVDFDGRYLVLESCDTTADEPDAICRSRVVDSYEEAAEYRVANSVRLASVVCCDPPSIDVFPPYLTVTWPPARYVVTDSAVRFEGMADPSATVTASGRYPVPVAPDGSWSMVLMLGPGGNTANFVAEDAAGNRTEVRHPVSLHACADAPTTPIPDVAGASTARGDVDGDGSPDTVSVYRVGESWFLGVELAYGWTTTLDITAQTVDWIDPAVAYRIVDLGAPVILVTHGGTLVGSTAGPYALHGCALVPLQDLDSGDILRLFNSVSIGNPARFVCEADGLVQAMLNRRPEGGGFVLDEFRATYVPGAPGFEVWVRPPEVIGEGIPETDPEFDRLWSETLARFPQC